MEKLADGPGVYRMLSEGSEPLYVGKAKSLPKRVRSYTQVEKQPVRLQRMIALTRSMEFVHTHTEAEALLLEANLIKKLKPRFNILLRDDKSFPYIHLTTGHDYPMVCKHRGARNKKGEYYGPFAGVGMVNKTITQLQRVFMLRNCTDYVFANRQRPCLQYHIKRCTAPCVGYVSQEEYAAQVQEAQDFLEGKSRGIQDRFINAMQKASAEMDYEEAAKYRDRIQALTSIQAHQEINLDGVRNADIVALYQKGGKSCVQVFFFRAGQNYGNRSYFPRHDTEEDAGDVLAAFIAQFYQNKPVPEEIFVSHEMKDKIILEEALASKRHEHERGRRLKITQPVRGRKKQVVDFALTNAREALQRHALEMAGEAELLSGVAKLFGLEEAPRRIEVYDNSHISGTNMVGAMIVAGPEGFQKNAYRKFNIKQAEAADDYAMMREVLRRRFTRALKADAEIGGADWPDMLLIDGGQGQYNAIKEVLEEMGIYGLFCLVAIAKGKDRNAGRETFFIEGKKPVQLPFNDAVLHYLQRLRDEAHRFAIGAHRTRRSKQISSSPLDEIAGIGPARKKALLLYFGSGKAVGNASVQDLAKVPGISRDKAQKIYDHFH